MSRSTAGLLLIASGALFIGCAPESKSSGDGAPSSAPTVVSKIGTPDTSFTAPSGAGKSAEAEAKEIFANRCTPCHGSKGAGDGAASPGLTPKPRNFTDASWQSSVTDEHIEKIIQYGGAAVGRSPMMPGNPDLSAKPEVVSELRKLIRSFAK